jgi:hypothetical protein
MGDTRGGDAQSGPGASLILTFGWHDPSASCHQLRNHGFAAKHRLALDDQRSRAFW